MVEQAIIMHCGCGKRYYTDMKFHSISFTNRKCAICRETLKKDIPGLIDIRPNPSGKFRVMECEHCHGQRYFCQDNATMCFRCAERLGTVIHMTPLPQKRYSIFEIPYSKEHLF